MSSDVCKHCTHAACLDVCPTGSLFRTEFGTVVVQEDICNGCGYCIPACPFGVIDQRKGDGRAWKCTMCYDRLHVGLEPACAQACPTNSIQFGPLAELREHARERVDELHPRRHRRAVVRWRRRQRCRRARRLLPAARRARGVPAPARPRRDDARSPRDVEGRGRGRGRARRTRRRRCGTAPVSGRDGRRGGRRERAMVPPADFRSYYDRPVLKQPVWKHWVPAYFFTGGLAAGSSLLAEVLVWSGDRRRRASCAGHCARRGRCRRGVPRRRPRSRRAVPPHAARVPAVVADEHGHVVAHRLRTGGRRRGVRRFRRPARRGACRRARSPRVSRPRSRPTRACSWPTPRCRCGTTRTASCRSSSPPAPPRARVRPRCSSHPGAVCPHPRSGSRCSAPRPSSARSPRCAGGSARSSARCTTRAKPPRFERGSRATTVAGAALLMPRATRRLGAALIFAGAALQRFAITTAGVQSARDPKYVVVPQRERSS